LHPSRPLALVRCGVWLPTRGPKPCPTRRAWRVPLKCEDDCASPSSVDERRLLILRYIAIRYCCSRQIVVTVVRGRLDRRLVWMFGHHGGRGHEFGHGMSMRGWGRGEGPRARRGDVKYFILEVLAQGPRHGYDVIAALEEKTGGRYRPSPGSVYPTLQLLE